MDNDFMTALKEKVNDGLAGVSIAHFTDDELEVIAIALGKLGESNE